MSEVMSVDNPTQRAFTWQKNGCILKCEFWNPWSIEILAIFLRTQHNLIWGVIIQQHSFKECLPQTSFYANVTWTYILVNPMPADIKNVVDTSELVHSFLLIR